MAKNGVMFKTPATRCMKDSHLPPTNTLPFRAPKQENATNKGMSQDTTPNISLLKDWNRKTIIILISAYSANFNKLARWQFLYAFGTFLKNDMHI